MLKNIQSPSTAHANPQARGLNPTLRDPIIREISPGSDAIIPKVTTTTPAIIE